jgi:mono/diheme cytochrome c family protein
MLTARQKVSVLILSIILLALTAFALYEDIDREWISYQKEFNRLDVEFTKKQIDELLDQRGKIRDKDKLKEINNKLERLRLKLASLKRKPPKIEQNWLREFNGEADRCTTCHLGVEKPGFEDKPHPYRTHSGDYLKHHAIAKFGCVTCHDGQAAGLDRERAHGEVEHWLRPLLKGGYAQSSCGRCHFMDQKLPLDADLPGGEMFVKGWRLYMQYNCLGCHKLSGYQRPERIGPVLTPVGTKVKPEWIKYWIKNPKKYLPKTVMPDFMLKDSEIELIATYLLNLYSEKGIDLRKIYIKSLARDEGLEESEAKEILDDLINGVVESVGNKEAIENGEKLVRQLGCLGCHTIEQIAKEGGDFGPNLSGISNKTSPEWLALWLFDPKVYQPGTPMPNLRIPEEEIPDIVAFLSTLKKGGILKTASSLQTSKEAIDQGRKLVKNKGCTGCHEIADFPLGFNAPEHDGIGSLRKDKIAWGNVKLKKEERTRLNYLLLKVKDPRQFSTDKIIMKMPKFGFTDEQAEALSTFLLSMKKEKVPYKYIKTLADPDRIEMRGKKFLEEKNCLGCHKIGKKGGNVGPDITDEWKKVRPDWLFNFLKSPYRIRPLQNARMPNFKLSDDEVETISEYLAYLSGESYPFSPEEKEETEIGELQYGERLYLKELACMGCHEYNRKGGYVGPIHTDMASRLKREWVEKWLKDPQSIKPDVRMPRFFKKDESEESDILMGEEELKALTKFLLTMGKERFLDVYEAVEEEGDSGEQK